MIAAAQQGEYYCPDAPSDGVDSADSPYYGNPNCIGGREPSDVSAEEGDPSPTATAGESGPFGLAGSTSYQ